MARQLLKVAPGGEGPIISVAIVQVDYKFPFGALINGSGGYLREPHYEPLEDLFEDFPEARVTGRAIYDMLWVKHPKQSSLLNFISTGLRNLGVVDRPIAEAIFALVATEDLEATLQYLRLVHETKS